jgi:outer membrane protein insertion porin family
LAAAVFSASLFALVATRDCGAATAASLADSAISDSTIEVTGNHHVGADAIRSDFRKGAEGRLDADALDAGLKSLYATGLFADVKITHDGDRVVVTVVENPTIGRIAFEGNKKLKDDALKKDLQSKESGPLWRPFVQGDAEHIVELYRQSGYFDTHVTPQTIKSGKGDAGRVTLVFTIKEGDKLAVRDIAFAGNGAFPDYKLKGVIKSGQTNFLSFLLDNDGYNSDRIENDRDLLRSFYQAHGYADVRVAASASYEAAKKGAVLTKARNIASARLTSSQA